MAKLQHFTGSAISVTWVCCPSLNTLPQQLQKLEVLCVNNMLQQVFSRLLTAAKNIKHVNIGGNVIFPQGLSLQHVLPQQVEMLTLEGNSLLHFLKSDVLRKGSHEEILEHSATSELPGNRLNLKVVAINMRGNLSEQLLLSIEQFELKLASIVVQLLICLPQLEYLIIQPPSEVAVATELYAAFVELDRIDPRCQGSSLLGAFASSLGLRDTPRKMFVSDGLLRVIEREKPSHSREVLMALASSSKFMSQTLWKLEQSFGR